MKSKITVLFRLSRATGIGILLMVLMPTVDAGTPKASTEEVVEPILNRAKMHGEYNCACEKLAAMAREKSTDAIFGYDDCLGELLTSWSVSQFDDVERRYWRRAILELRCTGLGVAYSLLSDLPAKMEKVMLNISPPIESGLSWSGISTNAIRDEKWRRVYAEAIAENSKRAACALLKHTLDEMSAEWEGSAMRFIKAHYPAGDDQSARELSLILARCIHDNDLRERLLDASRSSQKDR